MTPFALSIPASGHAPQGDTSSGKATFPAEQDDIPARKTTFSLRKDDNSRHENDTFARKVTLFAPKVTLFGRLPRHPARSVNTLSGMPAARLWPNPPRSGRNKP
jgi:hypothetical protein